MVAIRAWVCWMIVATGAAASADDWPTFRHDNHRSGKTSEKISAASLQSLWVWQSPQPPRPAWAGPAKWDAFAGLRGLRSMRNYDPVFHVIAAGGRVYFGSSADDSVYCLEAATGQQRWSYTTDGPVRIAPACVDGKLYFGSDDGHAYCLRADDGCLLWQYSPAPSGRRILNNGRLIPLWPCRTGVLVDLQSGDGGTAYFATGMLPWKASYLCAVDAQTGQLQGPGRYVQTLSGATMEGALLASRQRLFSPQGRIPPRVFDRAGGRSLGSLDGKGGGGCFALITDDDHVLHGPGNKTGWITDSHAATREKIATISGGNEMVVAGDTAYLLTDTRLSAMTRSSGKTRWNKPCEYPYALILAGETLFVGGRDAVAAFAVRDGALLWQGKVVGRAYGLAVAGGRLLVSTDEGAIHCFRPAAATAPTVEANAEEISEHHESKRPSSPLPPKEAPAMTLALGPYLQFTGPNSAIVRWHTEKPSPTILEYGHDDDLRRIENTTPKTEHEAELTGLRKDTVYHYAIKAVIDNEERATSDFECDTFFNYSPAAIAPRPGPYPDDEATRRSVEAARKILASTRVDRGICLLLGSGDGRLAYELARQSRLRVIGVETSAERVAASRRALSRAGVYGARVAVHRVDSLTKLPFPENFANLVVCSGDVEDGQSDFSIVEEAYAGAARVVRSGGKVWACWVRTPLEGAGVWSHQYGLPDNSGYGGESLQGARSVDDLAVQWVGRPGPRAQADRNGRKPSPLSVGGRLFMQGLHRIIAIDAHNGSIHWSLEIPQFERFNLPRDCSNWCADRQHVFAAIENKCWQIDAADGRVSKFYDLIPGANADWQYDWSYLARHGQSLIGSAVKSGTSFTEFFGGAGAGWYDSRSGQVTHKVCSDNLFSFQKNSGKVQWTYTGGLIVNPTITIGEGRIYFVEGRHAKAVDSDSRRLGMPEFWQQQFLVALNVETGRKIWEVPLAVAPGTVVFYLAYGGERLVLVSSDVKYHVYAFDAASGSGIWDAHFDWPGDNHGKHMSRPAIAGGKVFVRPKVIDLADGKIQETSMPGGGCGTYALTDRMAIFRAGNVTLWDHEGNRNTSWPRLRPGCWLSTIPAGGMLLAPEAGGGCSCGKWMETSIGFIPRAAQQ